MCWQLSLGHVAVFGSGCKRAAVVVEQARRRGWNKDLFCCRDVLVVCVMCDLKDRVGVTVLKDNAE